MRPVDARTQNAIDALAENDRQRWLVRNGHRAYDAYGASGRRRVAGVHKTASTPSDVRRRRARGSDSIGRRRSSSLGADVLTLGLFAGSVAFGLIGLVWTAIEVLRWVGEILGWGKA